MPEDSRAIVTEVSNAIAIISLNRPTQRNSLSVPTLQELKSALSALHSNDDIKAIIFTGTGDVFASGADIVELSQLSPSSALEFARFGQAIFQTIADAKQLTIAAINGYCMGGGLDLALACDVRVASKSAIFSHPGAARGIITGWGGTQRLPRLIGRARASELFATAQRLTSDEAFAIGLISGIYDPILASAMEIARSNPREKKAPNPRSGAF